MLINWKSTNFLRSEVKRDYWFCPFLLRQVAPQLRGPDGTDAFLDFSLYFVAAWRAPSQGQHVILGPDPYECSKSLQSFNHLSKLHTELKREFRCNGNISNAANMQKLHETCPSPGATSLFLMQCVSLTAALYHIRRTRHCNMECLECFSIFFLLLPKNHITLDDR